MKFHVVPLALPWTAILASASKVSFKQVKYASVLEKRGSGSASNTTLNLNTVQDLIYTVDINVGGQDYTVQFDTGSSDLWMKGPSHPLPGATATSTQYQLNYAIGWVSGNVSYAPVTFAELSIPSQAYLDVLTAQNPALEFGVSGVVGLGFTSLSSIDLLLNKTGNSTGRSLLYNLFLVNPQEPNFLAFSLQRSTEKNNTVEGSFSIGEYDPQYAQVANSLAIPTYPAKSPSRWTLLLDSVIVGENIVVPTTSVFGAPSNKAVVLMDSGSSFSYVSKEVTDALYANIPGAQFDSANTWWNVPCDYEVDMAIQMGGQLYPLHPLDVTPIGSSGTTTCVGSFVPQAVSVSQGDFDWILGDNFLRSVYSIYDFGDFDSNGRMGDPYMKFLSLIDPDEASVEFHATRGGVPNSNISYHGVAGASLAPSASLSQNIESSIDFITRILPALLALVALNVLILLFLVIGGVFYWRRTRRDSGLPARTPRGRLSPMPMNPRNTYIPSSQYRDSRHTYEPVSMAMSEDALLPPSPAFYNPGQPGRPVSTMSDS